MLTDKELLERWNAGTLEREISGNGSALAYAFERKVKDLEGQLSIAQEQVEVAADRAQSWKNLCEHYKELAEARGEALARRPHLDPHGRGTALNGAIIDAEAAAKLLLATLAAVRKEIGS